MQWSCDDCAWLLGDEARAWLGQFRSPEAVSSVLSARMRQALGSTKSEQILRLLELRRRGQRKFSRAAEMYFDRLGLEQATDEAIAGYKACSIPTAARVLDLCTGIGGDACSWGQRAQLRAVECDPGRAQFAAANLEVHQCREYELQLTRAEEVDVAGFDIWHIDPDRRASNRRTIDPQRMQPDWQQLHRWLQSNPHGGIKLAPGSRLDLGWERDFELEWIGHHRECLQLWLRSGSLARYPGQRVATVLSNSIAPWGTDDKPHTSLVAEPTLALRLTDDVGKYLVEPHAVVLAAGLSEAWAVRHDFAGFASRVAYFTADHSCHSPLVSCFRVEACLPLRLSRVRDWLRRQDTSVDEVKKRGVDVEPSQWLNRLQKVGARPLTLIATRLGKRAVAILATPARF